MRFLLVEAKEDIQLFINKFGTDIYDRFVKNKQRIKSMTGDSRQTDITWHTKNSSVGDIENLISSAESKQLDYDGRGIPAPVNTKKTCV